MNRATSLLSNPIERRQVDLKSFQKFQKIKQIGKKSGNTFLNTFPRNGKKSASKSQSPKIAS